MSDVPYGTWGSDDSHAVFRVKAGKQPDAPEIEAWDSGDGERFKISSVKWDGKYLSFTSTMPSTSWVVKHSWRFEGEALRGTRSSTPDRPYTLRPTKAKPPA